MAFGNHLTVINALNSPELWPAKISNTRINHIDKHMEMNDTFSTILHVTFLWKNSLFLKETWLWNFPESSLKAFYIPLTLGLQVYASPLAHTLGLVVTKGEGMEKGIQYIYTTVV